MRIGIDFDNTIICYDTVFNTVALEKGLIPATLEKGKNFVRDYLRAQDREDDWTKLQGYVYGKRLDDAGLYKGVKPFLSFCKHEKVECIIVSHKTKYPYAGEKYPLQDAALKWIEKKRLGIDAHFELTMERKAERIRKLECTHFIDDLPEFLKILARDDLKTILFDPHNRNSGRAPGDKKYSVCATSWKQIHELINHDLKSYQFKRK